MVKTEQISFTEPTTQSERELPRSSPVDEARSSLDQARQRVAMNEAIELLKEKFGAVIVEEAEKTKPSIDEMEEEEGERLVDDKYFQLGGVRNAFTERKRRRANVERARDSLASAKQAWKKPKLSAEKEPTIQDKPTIGAIRGVAQSLPLEGVDEIEPGETFSRVIENPGDVQGVLHKQKVDREVQEALESGALGETPETNE